MKFSNNFLKKDYLKRCIIRVYTHLAFGEPHAEAGTEEDERADAMELASAALNVLRNLSFVVPNRAAIAVAAAVGAGNGGVARGEGDLVAILARCVAAAGGGGTGGHETATAASDTIAAAASTVAAVTATSTPAAALLAAAAAAACQVSDDVPLQMAADAADILFNLAGVDDDAPLSAPCHLHPSPVLIAAVCSALEGEGEVSFTKYEAEAMAFVRRRRRRGRRRGNSSSGRGRTLANENENDDNDAAAADADVDDDADAIAAAAAVATTADIRCSAASVLSYLMTTTTTAAAAPANPSDTQLRRAVDTLVGNLPPPGPLRDQSDHNSDDDSDTDDGFDGGSGGGGGGEGGKDRSASRVAVSAAAVRVGIACVEALHRMAANGAGAGEAAAAAGHALAVDRIVALARGRGGGTSITRSARSACNRDHFIYEPQPHDSN